jgi:hypothetical protein
MTVKVEWVTTLCGCGCGVTFRQLRDPGREREYLNNAHKQRAYRARNPHKNHSGTRKESASARQRREQREAWAREQARQEQERERSYKRRHGFPPPPTGGVPKWCTGDHSSDSPAEAKARRRAYHLFMKADRTEYEDEARSCREGAENIRVKYGF